MQHTSAEQTFKEAMAQNAKTDRATRYQQTTMPSSKWKGFMETSEAKMLSAFGEGVSDSLIGMGHTLAHPIDNILLPTAELVGDVSALAFGVDYNYQSAHRMDMRWQNIKNAAKAEYDIFTGGNANDIAHELGGVATFFGGGAVFKGASALGGVSQSGKLLSKLGLWEKKEESARLLSSVNRVSSNIINKTFITEEALAKGWKPPYPNDLTLRKITTAQEITLYRVHIDADWPYGRFFAREKPIAPFLNNPEALRLHLGLPEIPI